MDMPQWVWWVAGLAVLVVIAAIVEVCRGERDVYLEREDRVAKIQREMETWRREHKR
jgi:hypothetical protein